MARLAFADHAFADHLPRHVWLWAIALGVFAATGFAPFGLWPVAFIAAGLAIRLFVLAGNPKQAAWLGWLFGWGHFSFSNYWIATAFTYQAEMPEVLGWFAVPLLAVYLAIYPALAVFVARYCARLCRRRSNACAAESQGGLAFLCLFAACWIVTEWLRGWVFTGYAWNPFAMILLGDFSRPGLAALAPWLGTYALSGLTMLLAGGVMLLLVEKRFVLAASAAVLLGVGMAIPAPMAREGTIALTIVQPDIRQATLTDPRFFETNFQRLARLSPRILANRDGPRLVLWPESGMVDYLRDGYPQRYYDRTTAFGSPLLARRRLGNTVGEGSILLTGAVDLEIGRDERGWRRALGARNAVTAVADDGTLIGGYFKAELVPYGEYLPMRSLLEPLGLSRLVAGSIDFWAGPGPQTLALGAYGKAGIQICYEIVFSGQVTDRTRRADYIFNPSNEAWFDPVAQPQFLAQSRMRAIEEGLPVLRATTTGISAVIDARGVVRDYLGHKQQGRIDTFIPPARAPTLFARFGNGLALFWAAVFLLLGCVALRRSRR